jgi:hypothetical protein
VHANGGMHIIVGNNVVRTVDGESADIAICDFYSSADIMVIHSILPKCSGKGRLLKGRLLKKSRKLKSIGKFGRLIVVEPDASFIVRNGSELRGGGLPPFRLKKDRPLYIVLNSTNRLID